MGWFEIEENIAAYTFHPYLITIMAAVLILTMTSDNKERFADDDIVTTVKKEVDGTIIKIPEKHTLNKEFIRHFKSHQPLENVKMASLLDTFEHNSHVLDVGAHIGDTGLYLALKAKQLGRHDIKVILIEPDKEKIEYINLLADLNELTNVTTMNYGVGMIHSKGVLDRSGKWSPARKVIIKDKGEFDIERLDTLITRRYPRIGLMHIDVEGMEHQALLGADRLLLNTNYVMIELNNIVDRTKERELLKKYNFEKILGGKEAGYKHGNVLYRRA